MPDPKAIEEEKPPVNEEITKVLEDLRTAADRINKPAEETPRAPVVNAGDRRAALQKSLGFTDEQMSAHEQMIRENNAPLVEGQGWTKLEKRQDLDTYRKEIEKELEIYPVDRRTPDLMEKIYYMVRGKHADSKPVTKEKPGVERVRVSGGPGYSGAELGLSGSGAGDGSGSADGELDDREKFVADKLGVDHAGYAKSKKAGKEIRELRLADARPVTSLADIELRRLTGKR